MSRQPYVQPPKCQPGKHQPQHRGILGGWMCVKCYALQWTSGGPWERDDDPALPPPKPETWQILDRSDANGPWYLVRDRNDAGYSPIHVMGPDALSDALRILWRRSVA